MKITLKFLKEKEACSEGVEWFKRQSETDAIKIIRTLVTSDHFGWANWLIVRMMTRHQCLAYAIYSTDQVIDIFERKYPNNNHPRKAIAAAKAVLKNDTKKTRAAAGTAAIATADAAAYADAAYVAAAYAAYAAYAADYAEAADAAAAYAATAYADYAEAAAADYAEAAAASALKQIRSKIIEHGISLIGEKDALHAGGKK